MPISFVCPDCGKKLKAVDSAAGKKAKCPACGSAVPIPVPKKEPELEVIEDDIFDEIDEEDGVAEDIEEDMIDCPMCGESIRATATTCRHCGESLRRRSGSKGRGRRSSKGVPIPFIGAVVVEIGFGLLNLFGIGGNLMQGNIPGALGTVVRLAINVLVTVGLFQKKAAIRITTFVLDGIGIFFMLACGVGLMALQNNPNLPPQLQDQSMLPFFLFVVALQVVMYIVQIVVLCFPSARDYLDQ